jgi:hypothetical protein
MWSRRSLQFRGMHTQDRLPLHPASNPVCEMTHPLCFAVGSCRLKRTADPVKANAHNPKQRAVTMDAQSLVGNNARLQYKLQVAELAQWASTISSKQKANIHRNAGGQHRIPSKFSWMTINITSKIRTGGGRSACLSDDQISGFSSDPATGSSVNGSGHLTSKTCSDQTLASHDIQARAFSIIKRRTGLLNTISRQNSH